MKKSDVTIATSIAVLVVIGIGVYYFVSHNSSNVASNVPASTTQGTQTQTAPTSNQTAPTTPVATPTIPTSPQPASVTISNFSFNPAQLSVKAGTKVTWTNQDSTAHTVTSNSGAFDSKTINPGGTFSFTFNTPGTFSYHCSIHPSMTATIVVTQ